MDELPYTESGEASPADDLNWDDFRVFLEVVRTGSFNRASVRLNMTQATVSRRLARLEARIGVRLFDRDRRGPRLTFEGQRIYNDTSTAHFALARAANQVLGGGRVEGDCKIFMGDGIASYWMTRFLPLFFTRYPGIELKLFGAYDTAADKRAIFDLQVHYYEPAEAEPVALRVGTMHFVPFASRDYLRQHGVPESVDDLQKHRLLDLAAYLADMGSWSALSRDGMSKHTALFTNLSACLAEAVKHGAGIALLPTYSAVVDPAFVPLELGVRFHAPIFVSYQREAPKNWAVRTTIDFLRHKVFNRKTMPWFSETFSMPSPDWAAKLRLALADDDGPEESEAPPRRALAHAV